MDRPAVKVLQHAHLHPEQREENCKSPMRAASEATTHVMQGYVQFRSKVRARQLNDEKGSVDEGTLLCRRR